MNYEKGFTIVEVIVVAGMVGFVGIFLMKNFGSGRLNLNEAASILLADVRDMQARAIAGSRYGGQTRCGYGIARFNSDSYRLYAGPVPAVTTNCTSYNRNYNNGGPEADSSILVKSLKDSDKIQFEGNFSDVFFEPVEPKVFINNSFSLSNAPARITIRITGGNCSNPTRCKSICVYPSGRVEMVNGSSCP